MKKIILSVFVLLALSALQSVDAYTYRTYSFGDYDSSCKYWDYNEFKWRTDRVCQWVENGDGWREEAQRYQAVVWQANSYDMRYNIQSGRSSGDAFYYRYGDKSETKPSDWRYKTTFDPRVDNEYVKGYGYYYYQPRYDYTSGTYNWRF